MSRPYQQLKRNLYDNLKVYGLNGDLMFYGNKRKLDWYVNRNLAAVISENPYSIRLIFETNGPGNAGDEFYLQHRDNICSVCGAEENLTRHHVVPFGYRKYFPHQIKAHSYHDVLLLCINCHDEYEKDAVTLKNQLAAEFNASIHGNFLNKKKVEDILYAQSLGRNLIKYWTKIPQAKKIEMISKIREIINEYDLKVSPQNIAHIKEDPAVITHGEMVVKQLTADQIQEFICRWRKHFVDTMLPQFLPLYWSVNRVECRV